MDDNSQPNSSNQATAHTLNVNARAQAIIHHPERKLNTPRSNTPEPAGRHTNAAANHHSSRDSLLDSPIFRYSRLFKRHRLCKRYVGRSTLSSESHSSLQKLAQNAKKHSHKQRRRRNKCDSQAFSRKEFYRRISVISAWYDKLPIIKSKRNSLSVGKSEFASERREPVLVETLQGLDIKFDLSALIEDLTCSLCTGLFHNAHTIKECMHTFCKSCLVLHTLENGLVCPTCSSPMHSDLNDSIEYDHNIQGLVDKLFPHFVELERKQMRELNRFLGRSPEECNPGSTSPGSEAERPGQTCLVDSTSDFMSDVVRGRRSLDSLLDNVLCLALIHEADGDLKRVFESVSYSPDDLLARGGQEPARKYPRKYICVPRTVYVDHIVRYLAHELVLEPKYNVVFTLKNAVLSKNHTFEFVCKSARIDMSKCVILRYKVLLEPHH